MEIRVRDRTEVRIAENAVAGAILCWFVEICNKPVLAHTHDLPDAGHLSPNS